MIATNWFFNIQQHLHLLRQHKQHRPPQAPMMIVNHITMLGPTSNWPTRSLISSPIYYWPIHSRTRWALLQLLNFEAVHQDALPNWAPPPCHVGIHKTTKATIRFSFPQPSQAFSIATSSCTIVEEVPVTSSTTSPPLVIFGITTSKFYLTIYQSHSQKYKDIKQQLEHTHLNTYDKILLLGNHAPQTLETL